MSHQYKTIGDTVYFWFGSNDTSGSGDDGANPVWAVRLAGAAAGDAAVDTGVPTLLTHNDFNVGGGDFTGGCHEVAVAATVGNGFAAGNTYAVFCTILVDAQNPTGFVGSFELKPIIANMIQVDGTAAIAAAIKSIFNGTGIVDDIDIQARSLTLTNADTGPGLLATGTTHGAIFTGTAGPGMRMRSTGGNGPGLECESHGNGEAVSFVAPGAGNALTLFSDSGVALRAAGATFGIQATAAAGDGISAVSTGGNGDGFVAIGNGAGVDIRGDITGDILGTLSVCTTNTDMRGTDGANTTVPDAAGTAPTAIENADMVFSRSMLNVEAAVLAAGAAGVHTLCNVILQHLESSVLLNILTITQTDGVTVQLTRTLTVDAAADPITGVSS